MHNTKKADAPRTKNEVRRLFAEGQIDPNAATARLLELDRQALKQNRHPSK